MRVGTACRLHLDVQLQQLAVQASQATAPEGSPAQQVGDHHRAALDMRQRDAAGLQPIQADLDWAVRASGPADLAQLSLRLQASSGSSPLLRLTAMADMKDSSRMLLMLQRGTLQLSNDQYSNPAARTIRDLYVGHITRVHQQPGDAPEVAAAKARTILAMETVLAARYNQFQLLPGLNLDGALTLGENAANLGGITLAHAALHRARHRTFKGQPQAKVDGLTTDQRCFVAWAQPWIVKARDENIRMLAAIDVHGNSVVRGQAPLMTLDAFHQAFGTRPGDAMWRKPADRVRIW